MAFLTVAQVMTGFSVKPVRMYLSAVGVQTGAKAATMISFLLSDVVASDADVRLARWSNSSGSAAIRIASLVDDLMKAIQADGAKNESGGDKGNDWFLSQLTEKVRKNPKERDITTLF